MVRVRSANELAVVAGVTRGQIRMMVAEGVIDIRAATWVDALVARVYVPARSVVMVGEQAGRSDPHPVRGRADEAARVVREAADRGELGRDAVLSVSRGYARIYASLEELASSGAELLYSEGTLLILPVGQWWSELRWRVER